MPQFLIGKARSMTPTARFCRATQALDIAVPGHFDLAAEHNYAPTVLVKVAAPAFERHDNEHGIDVPRRRMTGSAA
jgi:hypothetical protein